jgi:ribosomal protein S12 methylthiotransferase accessory factor
MANEPWIDLVSPRTGVIRSLRPQSRAASEPEPPHLWTAWLSNYDFQARPRTDRVMAGKGATEASAKAAAVGEAVERYCAAHWGPTENRFTATLDEVDRPCLTPDDCVLYSAEQYRRKEWPYPPWNPSQPITWVHGHALRVHPTAPPESPPTTPSREEGNRYAGEPVALPAGAVYLSATVPRTEDVFAQMTSNGLAAGVGLGPALLGGLCELMERDALMISWMNRLPGVEIDLPRSGGLSAAIHRHYASLGVRVRCFALPTDLPVTAVIALGFDDTADHPATVAAAGCHPSPTIAVEKAVLELCQARPAERARFRDHPPAGRLNEYRDVVNLDDHSAFAAMPQQRGEFAFLWSTGTTSTVGELEDRSESTVDATLATCTEGLDQLGHRTAFVDLTTPDIRPTGYRVVRVIAAGLQPIHFGYGRERLGGDRLYTLPSRLGLADQRVSTSDLNPCPHPMA